MSVRDSRRPPYWEPDAQWLTKYKSYIAAVKAVFEGTATADQQRRALDFILEEFCERNISHFFPNQRDTDFALGKKFVGDMIAQVINTKLGQIKESK